MQLDSKVHHLTLLQGSSTALPSVLPFQPPDKTQTCSTNLSAPTTRWLNIVGGNIPVIYNDADCFCYKLMVINLDRLHNCPEICMLPFPFFIAAISISLCSSQTLHIVSKPSLTRYFVCSTEKIHHKQEFLQLIPPNLLMN